MAEQKIGVTVRALSHKQYAFLIGALYMQYLHEEISEEDFALLLRSLVAEDMHGAHWTFAPQRGAWLQVDSEEWVEGEPRGPLRVPLLLSSAALLDEIKAWLQEIDDRMPPPRPREPAPTLAPTLSPVPAPEQSPPAVRIFCVACGHRLKAGAAFCSYCGKPTG
jgi:hypothetical protein